MLSTLKPATAVASTCGCKLTQLVVVGPSEQGPLVAKLTAPSPVPAPSRFGRTHCYTIRGGYCPLPLCYVQFVQLSTGAEEHVGTQYDTDGQIHSVCH
ncbi:hypothetical protein B0H12DRAFT_701404 [Mycena haematopus]|nr:hypothetical protein B0H12DRAFT_701404 [Mycena haematopus]